MTKLQLKCSTPSPLRLCSPVAESTPALSLPIHGCGPLTNPQLGFSARGLPAGPCAAVPVNQFAAQASMDPRAASLCRSRGGHDGFWSPADIQQNIGETFGRQMIPLHVRTEQTLKLGQMALLSALQGGSQRDLISILGAQNPGSAKLARSIAALAHQLRTNPNDISQIGRMAQQIHWDMVPHVATNRAERDLGRRFLQQAYGMQQPGTGHYNGRGAIGNTISSHAPGATAVPTGQFVTSDPSQSGLQALRAAQSQIGVREASGNNDGLPSQRYSGGRNQPWCADFVSWSFRQTGHELPGNQRRLAGVSYMESQMKAAGKLHKETPKPGDIIFFRNRMASDKGSGRHVGIVEKVEGGRVFTIEGNSGNSVRRRSYPLDATKITGYARP